MAGVVAIMSTIKVFSLGGLDKKSNDLTRATDKASDMLNMEYDTQSTLKKRNGFEVFSTEDSKDMIYYNSKEEFLLFNESTNVTILNKNGAVKQYNGTNYYPLPAGISALSNVSISFCENSNNLYFTNTDYNTYIMKYDGGSIYRAGLPTPRKTSTTSYDFYPTFTNPVGGFCRFFYSYKDLNGNVTLSPYYQPTSNTVGGSSVLSVNSFRTDPSLSENGFYNKYCYIAKTGHSNITSSARTLTVTKHNYVAGDKFLMDTENQLISISNNKTFVILDVESITLTSITFTAASIGTNTISLADGSIYYATEYPVDIRCKIHTATSPTADTGYTILAVYVIDNSIITNSISYSQIEAVISLGQQFQPAFEDVYDSTTLKIMPPICQYLSSFGNQIVYGSIRSVFSTLDNQLKAPNQRTEYANDDFIVYSDVSAGDGPENTSPLNIQKIGETWDGYISGMRRCNDSLVIFKNRGVFTIDGALVSGEYQLRKINTNFAGCTSHKSILESDEGLYFQAHNGLYFTNGIGVKKITYEIDSVFGSANYTTTKSVRLKKKQKSLFYVSELAKVVVIDYYYNQIYFWDNINASNGMVEDSLGNVYFSTGTNIYKFNDGYLDDTSPINATYSTTWHHAGEPALNKKFLSLRMFALSNDVFTATIKTEGDWSANQLTTNTLTFNSADQTKFLMLDMQTKKSLRFTFSNNVKKEISPGVFEGENMVITGYEITFEMFNNVDKN